MVSFPLQQISQQQGMFLKKRVHKKPLAYIYKYLFFSLLLIGVFYNYCLYIYFNSYKLTNTFL